MILWKFKEEPETRDQEPGNTHDWPCKAFRWVIDVGYDHGALYAGAYHQYQRKCDGSWNTSHTNLYEVTLGWRFSWGSKHFYYDGPHCSLSLGPIRFNWGSWCCKECLTGIP